MRLIDADSLIEEMKKTESEHEKAMTCPSWWSAFNVISEQTTAYDIEKVVGELEIDSSVKLCGSGNSDNYLIPVKKAIEIVKQGSVSDDACEWKYNDTEYCWESSCDHFHIFMADGPKENEYEYCPYCGKNIKVVK